MGEIADVGGCNESDVQYELIDLFAWGGFWELHAPGSQRRGADVARSGGRCGVIKAVTAGIRWFNRPAQWTLPVRHGAGIMGTE